MMPYKDDSSSENIQNRIKTLSNDIDLIHTTDISNEISFIISNFDQINEKENQKEILIFLKIVSNVDYPSTISTLSSFPLIDFLLVHYQIPLFEDEKEIFIEIIGLLLKNSDQNKSEDLLNFFLSQLLNYNPNIDQNTNFLYHLLYGTYQFFSENFSEKFCQISFFEKLIQFYNIAPEIDILLIQFALESSKSFKLNLETIQFILFSLQFYNEETADLISYLIYCTYKRDPGILRNDLAKETFVRCISNTDNFDSQKYSLKLLSRLDENDIQFLNYNTIIIDSIFIIFEKSKNNNNQLLLFAIPVVYRALQLSLSLAELLFFDTEKNRDLTLFISETILTNNYKLRNWGILVFSQIMRNLPRKIYPFLVKPELQKLFYDILTTVIDVDENEDSLIIFMTSIDGLIKVLSTDENLLFNLISILQRDEILQKISELSNSENEELSATFQMISENLSLILENLSS